MLQYHFMLIILVHTCTDSRCPCYYTLVHLSYIYIRIYLYIEYYLFIHWFRVLLFTSLSKTYPWIRNIHLEYMQFSTLSTGHFSCILFLTHLLILLISVHLYVALFSYLHDDGSGYRNPLSITSKSDQDWSSIVYIWIVHNNINAYCFHKK